MAAIARDVRVLRISFTISAAVFAVLRGRAVARRVGALLSFVSHGKTSWFSQPIYRHLPQRSVTIPTYKGLPM
jgi:hypothetical protein